MYLYFWFPMIVLAFANATLREVILKNHFHELRSNQISTLTLMSFCAIYVFFVFPLLKIGSTAIALRVGLLWMILTFLFETLLGKATGRSWGQIFENYNLSDGHIWPLFLLFLFILPALVLNIRS